MATGAPARQSEYMSAQEFALKIDVPARTVLAWRKRGIGPASAKLGKHVRYRRVDVDAWLAQQVNAS